MRENGRVCRLKYRADISDGIFIGNKSGKVETAKCSKLPRMETKRRTLCNLFRGLGSKIIKKPDKLLI
nr:hypothetical protein [Neisseria meningitidis]